MAISPEANVALLEAARARSALGAAAAANAMAKYIAERTANDTLRRNITKPGTYYRARPGAPPSYGTGALAAAMYSAHEQGGLRASAIAGNNDPRARVFEFGCVLTPTNGTHLGWRDSGRKDNPSGIWRHRSVNMEEHPFLEPTTDEAINDGELHRIAVDAFREYDP